MTMQVKDLPENHGDTLATRLRDTRESRGLSRAEVAKRTGIPAKSIEKFEYGTQEPSVSRLMTICDEYDVSIDAMLGLETPGPEPANDDEPAALPKTPAPAVENSVEGMLRELDELRRRNFENGQRRAMALADELIAELRFLEPDELLELSEKRGLYQGDCPDLPDLLGLFSEDMDKAQAYCGNVEERIVDTAVLGADLYNIDEKPLKVLADQLEAENDDLEAPGLFGGWGEHGKFVPLIRPYLRNLAVLGRGPDFQDTNIFALRDE